MAGWFYSFEINNWHGLSKLKNAMMKRAGKGFLRSLSGKGRVHFSAKEGYIFRQRVLRKMCKRQRAMPEGKSRKRVKFVNLC
jgi:hypothetical protein